MFRIARAASLTCRKSKIDLVKDMTVGPFFINNYNISLSINQNGLHIGYDIFYDMYSLQMLRFRLTFVIVPTFRHSIFDIAFPQILYDNTILQYGIEMSTDSSSFEYKKLDETGRLASAYKVSSDDIVKIPGG